MKEKLAEFFNVIFGFRKFILMLVVYLVGIIFRIKAYISGSEMVDLFKATTISFFGANGVEHIMTVVKEFAINKGQKIVGGDNIIPVEQIEPDEAEEAKAEESSNG